MADTHTLEKSLDEVYSVTFEERFWWTSFFDGERQRRAIVTKTSTLVTEEAPFEEIEADVVSGFPPTVEVDPSSSLDYTITNTNWRHDQGAYYTKVLTEIHVETFVGAWVPIETVAV